jgi:uncharacterized SAM-binding protein YcdF (DUF218 family)
MDLNEALKKLWDYLSISNEVKESEVIFALGRDDFAIAGKAAELFKMNVAPLILVAGGRGRLTGAIEGSEASAFGNYLQKEGVPAGSVLLEESSSNTEENISAGLARLSAERFAPKRVLLVTHRSHMRRALAVAREQSSKIEWLAVPDGCTRSSCSGADLARELVGEIDRLEKYPRLGYFADQDIPAEVFSARRIVEDHFKGG